MSISHDGYRARFYAERKQVVERLGNPLREEVSEATRKRIASEIRARAGYRDDDGHWHSFEQWMVDELNRCCSRKPLEMFMPGIMLDIKLARLPLDEFLQALEICVSYIARYRKDVATVEINRLQSFLADDLSMFRIVDTGTGSPRYQVQRLDNPHLHRVITDRTFELTMTAEFASAQNDYTDAWKAYSKGETDVALTDAHKAVESAAKAVIKKADPNSTPENLQLGPLVQELRRVNVIPQELIHVCGQLDQIFRNSGSLRNQAGAAHGSLDPTSPEASVALLGLRLSGTLIAFLAERWLQMK